MNSYKIIKFIRQHRLTKNEFCKMCNISPTILDNIVYYDKNTDYQTAKNISTAMGIGVYELYTYDY